MIYRLPEQAARQVVPLPIPRGVQAAGVSFWCGAACGTLEVSNYMAQTVRSSPVGAGYGETKWRWKALTRFWKI